MQTIIDSELCKSAKQALSKLGKVGTVSKKNTISNISA